jgi:putative phosphoesterase
MPDLIEPSTARLLLRQWRSSDREPFAALNGDPRVMEFFPSILTRPESDALADRCEAFIAERGWGFWAVELKEDRRLMGFVGLHTPTELPFSPCTEIGWRLAVDYWGHGFATEAAREALRVGFEVLGLEEIVSFTAVGNRRSRAVMERLGMTDSGLFEHPRVPVGSPLRAHCLYRLRRSGGPARRASTVPSRRRRNEAPDDRGSVRTRVGLISDTHWLLRPEAVTFLRGSDFIVHAGDVGSDKVLEILAHLAPVTVVRGNNDTGPWAETLPEDAVLEVDGVSLYVLHDLADLKLDPAAAGFGLVVSGHSHRPSSETRDGVLYINPGSAGPRRFKLPISIGELQIADGAITSRHVEITI